MAGLDQMSRNFRMITKKDGAEAHLTSQLLPIPSPKYRLVSLDNVKESTDKDGAVVIDPDAEPNAHNKNKKSILGFAFKWIDSSAHIYAYEEPEVYGYQQLSTEQKRKEEKNAHNKVQEFVNNGGED
jgi:hypothetical protein